MGPDAALLIVLLCSPGIVFLVHAVLCRIVRTGSRQKVAVAAVGLGYVPTGALLWHAALAELSGAGLLRAAGYGMLVYSALAYCYFHFFNMSETARRIKILAVVHEAGRISQRDLESFYKTTDVVEARLERLVALGQLRYEAGRYSISGRTLVWAGYAVLCWRRLLGMDKDGTGI